MEKIIKVAAIFLFLLILVCSIGYFSIAFYEYDLDISHWGKHKRGALLGCILFYLTFTPLIWMKIEGEI